jgi:hypothetical protein
VCTSEENSLRFSVKISIDNNWYKFHESFPKNTSEFAILKSVRVKTKGTMFLKSDNFKREPHTTTSPSFTFIWLLTKETMQVDRKHIQEFMDRVLTYVCISTTITTTKITTHYSCLYSTQNKLL